jgi:hypothetical protein
VGSARKANCRIRSAPAQFETVHECGEKVFE